MILREMKERMLLPERQLIINKACEIRGRKVVIAAITQQNGKNSLWLLLQCPHPSNDQEDASCAWLDAEHTHRLALERHVRFSASGRHFTIKEAVIRGQKLTFAGSSGSSIEEDDISEMMKLQYLLQQKIDFSIFDDMEMSSLFLYEYELKETPFFSEGELTHPDGMTSQTEQEPFSVILELDDEHVEKYIGRRYRMCFEQETAKAQELFDSPKTAERQEAFCDARSAGERESFYDAQTGKEHYFYVNKLARHDVWAEIEAKDWHAHYKEISEKYGCDWDEAQLNEHKNAYLQAMEEMCPKGFVLAMVEYETEEDIQLVFYETDYLDQVPQPSSSMSSTMAIIGGERKGPHGLALRSCLLRAVPKTFDEPVTVELFSWYMRTPGGNIHIA